MMIWSYNPARRSSRPILARRITGEELDPVHLGHFGRSTGRDTTEFVELGSD
jgi:hypothetical protein